MSRKSRLLVINAAVAASCLYSVPAWAAKTSLSSANNQGINLNTQKTTLYSYDLLTGVAAGPNIPGPVLEANNFASWILDADGTWGVAANWDTGIVPNDPTDTATFPFRSSGPDITMDVDRTVNSLTWTSPGQYDLLPNGPTQTTITVTSGNINVNDGPRETFNSFFGGQAIRVNVGGASGFNKSGAAPMQLNPNPGGAAINSTFQGNMNITQGVLGVGADTHIGDPANSVNISNGATFRTLAAISTTSRGFVLGTGGGNFQTFGAIGIDGVISGSGDLTKNLFTGGNMILRGANTYTGATIIKDNGGFVLDGGGGTAQTTSRLDLGGALILNVAAANSDRLSDTLPVNSFGGLVFQTGRSSGTSETTGALTLTSAHTMIHSSDSTLSNVSGQVTFASLTRNNRATMGARGRNLGSTPGSGVGNIFFTNPAGLGLVGGSGAAGSTNINISPFVVGNADANTTATGLSNAGLVTYDTNGLRPLGATEYVSSPVDGSNTTNNVRLTANTVFAQNTTMNALVLSGITDTDITGAGQLTVTSGAIVNSVTGGNGGFIANPVDFGGAEGVILHAAGSVGVEFGGVISGSNGVTSGGHGVTTQGVTILGNTASTYTGTTTVTSGYIIFAGSVNNTGAPSSLGQSTTPVIISNGSNVILSGGNPTFTAITGILAADPNTTFDRNIILRTGSNMFFTSGLGDIGTTFAAGSGNVTYNGNVSIEGGTLRLNGDIAPTADPTSASMIFNGIISGGRVADFGNGILTDAAGNPAIITFQNTQRLNGANTYTGSTTILQGKWQAGNDSAFGTGPIIFNGGVPTTGTGATNPNFPESLGSMEAVGAARTIANELVLRSTPHFVGSLPLTFTGPVDLGGGIRGVDVQSTAPVTFSGVVQKGGIAKRGAGVLVLSNNGNTHTSQTQVLGGTLRVTAGGALGASQSYLLTTPASAGSDTFVLNDGVLELVGGVAASEADFTTNEAIFVRGATTFGPSATGNLRNVSGNNTVNNRVFFNDPTRVSVGVDAGTTLTLMATGDDTGTASTGAINKVGDGQLNIPRLRLPGNNVVNAGKVAIIPTTIANSTESTSNINSLAIAGGPLAPTAKFDLGNNGLVYNYTATSPLTDVRLYLQKGYNGGNWAGNGITSSKAATSPNPFGPEAEGGKTALGYAEVSDLGALSSFLGQPVDSTTVVIKYTYEGDGNLDGQVDITDLGKLATAWQTAGDWNDGDFDYNGFIDITDLGKLATNWQVGVGAPLGQDFNSALAAVGLGGVAVPEPATAMLAVAAFALLPRRRR